MLTRTSEGLLESQKSPFFCCWFRFFSILCEPSLPLFCFLFSCGWIHIYFCSPVLTSKMSSLTLRKEKTQQQQKKKNALHVGGCLKAAECTCLCFACF